MAELLKEVGVRFTAETGDGHKFQKEVRLFEIGTHLDESRNVRMVHDGHLKIGGEYKIEILYGKEVVLAKKEKLPPGSIIDRMGSLYNRGQGLIKAIPLKVGSELEKVVPDATTKYLVNVTLASENEGFVYLGFFIKAAWGKRECGDNITVRE